MIAERSCFGMCIFVTPHRVILESLENPTPTHELREADLLAYEMAHIIHIVRYYNMSLIAVQLRGIAIFYNRHSQTPSPIIALSCFRSVSFR